MKLQEAIERKHHRKINYEFEDKKENKIRPTKLQVFSCYNIFYGCFNMSPYVQRNVRQSE